ncbi:hypothetical protein ACFPOI_59330 [Nonomuraea angiospora]|uniref:Uncharacterized protein n=1 Tax=Nonomuraea angiospora TaxID=46172 RepID=A0ABR9LQG5_9ACTN|nr:hypothetical protein [Nonomuraea angiospora]MBE1582891.1 hypothetical protein [Nonomuraea angiospora]
MLVEQLDLVAEVGVDRDVAALWTAVIAEAGASKEQVLVALEQKNAARLSPLGHARLNVPGRYSISSSAPTEGLRQLGEIPDPDGGGVNEEGV